MNQLVAAIAEAVVSSRSGSGVVAIGIEPSARCADASPGHRRRVPGRVAVSGLRRAPRRTSPRTRPSSSGSAPRVAARRPGSRRRPGPPPRMPLCGSTTSPARSGRFAALRKIEPQEFTSSGSTVSRPSGRMPWEKPFFAGSQSTARIACRSVSAAVGAAGAVEHRCGERECLPGIEIVFGGGPGQPIVRVHRTAGDGAPTAGQQTAHRAAGQLLPEQPVDAPLGGVP